MSEPSVKNVKSAKSAKSPNVEKGAKAASNGTAEKTVKAPRAKRKSALSYTDDPSKADLAAVDEAGAIGPFWWRQELDPASSTPKYHGWRMKLVSAKNRQKQLELTYEHVGSGRSIVLRYEDRGEAWFELPTTATAVGKYGWLFIDEMTAYNNGLPPPDGKWPNTGAMIWDGVREQLFQFLQLDEAGEEA